MLVPAQEVVLGKRSRANFQWPAYSVVMVSALGPQLLVPVPHKDRSAVGVVSVKYRLSVEYNQIYRHALGPLDVFGTRALPLPGDLLVLAVLVLVILRTLRMSTCRLDRCLGSSVP